MAVMTWFAKITICSTLREPPWETLFPLTSKDIDIQRTGRSQMTHICQFERMCVCDLGLHCRSLQGISPPYAHSRSAAFSPPATENVQENKIILMDGWTLEIITPLSWVQNQARKNTFRSHSAGACHNVHSVKRDIKMCMWITDGRCATACYNGRGGLGNNIRL